ncbi:hypothetical protein [Dokdonia sp. 4H-3-7-5]|uniref:hypothetical protein n=1 Tax=Dokdonia sp. (strain 4H-3-7-5) TaxID=983548 RepID=UPI00192A8142|nr:hypothetical protein [Dokdonia sp. 4H-3-7-5]
MNSKMQEYTSVLVEQVVQERGSLEILEDELKEGTKAKGELTAIFEILFPFATWDEQSINLIPKIQEMNGVNDLIAGLVTTEIAHKEIDFDSFSKSMNPIGIAMAAIGLFEWMDTNVLSMESLEHDINMSKNTRRTWLKFFFEKPTDSLEITTKPHKFYKVRKISPKDYFHIWGKFIIVDMADFDDDFKDRIAALKQGWVVSKKDLKNKYNKRSEDIKIALEDAVEQPDYPSSWPKVIPDKDKFPYSVSLFIARELSLM